MIGGQAAKPFVLGAALCAAPFALSDDILIPEQALSADVVFLGEQHDNPQHHVVQAEYVETLRPAAIVFEMLTPAQADLATPDVRSDELQLEAALEWEASGWPDFSMYYPIFSAAPAASIFGAGVTRDQLRGVITTGFDGAVDQQLVSRFNLNDPLPTEQQQARENLQRESHCNALPEEMLPGMVKAQRLRDAALAHAAVTALEETGGPIVVITGNGHARTDWGAPFLLKTATPEIEVFALGQGEGGSMPDGTFTMTGDGPVVDRGDPCAAFK